MLVEIIKVEVENKGKYRQANVTYKGADGKVDANKKIMSFTYKDVFTELSQAQLGDKFEIKTEKNEKGYWDWTEAVRAGKNTAPAGKSYSESVTKGGNWETAEERAKRQVYIVRQSSISAALELAKLNGIEAPVTEQDVIASARVFEAFVFGIEPAREVEVD